MDKEVSEVSKSTQLIYRKQSFLGKKRLYQRPKLMKYWIVIKYCAFTSCRMFPSVPPRKATLMTIQGPLTVIRAIQKEEGTSSGFSLFEMEKKLNIVKCSTNGVFNKKNASVPLQTSALICKKVQTCSQLRFMPKF